MFKANLNLECVDKLKNGFSLTQIVGSTSM